MGNVVDLNGRRESIDQAVMRHPANGNRVTSEREVALENLEQVCVLMDELKSSYQEAVFRCKELDIPNTVIARRAGRTEAAIRMFVRRKQAEA